MTNSCFALLDDNTAPPGEKRSRLYRDLIIDLTCNDINRFDEFLTAIDQALSQSRHVVGLFPYELGNALSGIASSHTTPLARALVFSDLEMIDGDAVTAWLGPAAGGIAAIEESVTEDDFIAAIDRIQDEIRHGQTYQVNYSFRLRFDAFGPVAGLYRRLRERQAVSFGALIGLPDDQFVLSLSPELFIRHNAGRLTARPMKGTAPAATSAAENAERTRALAEDAKNRAENLMIVDLLRNDLARIAELGSVAVPALFEVTRYGDVLQMTSTVEARAKAGTRLPDLFAALYPCGSITGAPKLRTMQIIQAVESEPRGLYTGAIGWFDAPLPGHDLPELCLSVPIRTMELGAEDAQGIRKGNMGIGAGIVTDSIASEELRECRLKGRFLTGLPNAFQLIETIHATRELGCRNLSLHLDRLRGSAGYFAFRLNEGALLAQLNAITGALPPDQAFRLRLALSQDGTHDITVTPLPPVVAPVKLILATEPTRSRESLLRHKTSQRAVYNAAIKQAAALGGFDMLFCNELGHLTEGGRSNLFLKLHGQWYTPPLSDGVLPGVMRRKLLAEWRADERSLTIADLKDAEQIIVCNALYGPLVGEMFDHAVQSSICNPTT